ncbi:MAG: caspase family protein [Pseudomonadota bacterium]
MYKLYIFISLFYICTVFSTSNAQDRALLIGVGEYKNNIKNLPGVLLDIETMRDSAQILGFKEKNIKVLLNEQATLKNIRNTIKTWLIDGTNVDDKVLIYFSGHGSRIPDLNNDEIDGADEVLVLYDSLVTKINNNKTITNVLIDDEFSLYLQQIKSHDLMLLVDACNSGTVYRGISSSTKKATGKFLNYAGMPQTKSLDISDDIMALFSSSKNTQKKDLQLIDKAQTSANNPVLQAPLGFRFVAITAAGDDELALTTKKGSIFTQGLHFYLKQAAINHQQLTPRQLIDKISLYIEKKVQQDKLGAVYQPQIAGNIELVNKAITFVDSPQARVNWNRLEALDISTKKLTINTSKKHLSLGESLELNINIPHQGYLNVITVGPDDQVFILYPNPWEPKNLLPAGIFHLPTSKMDFEIKLTRPVGTNLMLAVLTNEPINLYLQSIEGRDRFGRMFSSLNALAQSANMLERSLSATSETKSIPAYLSGRILVEVK